MSAPEYRPLTRKHIYAGVAVVLASTAGALIISANYLRASLREAWREALELPKTETRETALATSNLTTRLTEPQKTLPIR